MIWQNFSSEKKPAEMEAKQGDGDAGFLKERDEGKRGKNAGFRV